MYKRQVLDGQRYKSVSKEIKAYCRGEYGHTPAPIDPEIQKMILGDEQPLTCLLYTSRCV